jgi:hypothetical protein
MVTGLGDVPFYHHETRICFFTLLALAYLYTAEPPALSSAAQEGQRRESARFE